MTEQPEQGQPTVYELTDCRHGRFLRNVNDSYVGRSLATYGEWSEAEARLFQKIVRPGDTVVEAGANIGTHTVVLSRAVGDTGQVLAFEAARLTHQLLCANLALNECFNVQAHHCAVGRYGRTVQFPALNPRAPSSNYGGAGLRMVYPESNWPTESVPMRAIDDLELPHIDFMKTDVEGHEPELLRGAHDTLRRQRPAVYVEIDVPDLSRPTGNRDELLELMHSAGYECYYYFAPMFIADNWRGVSTDLFNAYSLDMLCVPPEKFQVQGLSRAQPGDNALTSSNGQGGLVITVAPWHAGQVERR